MFSLAYTPSYDPYHTVFRFLTLLSSAKEYRLKYRVLRTADFFLCFPWSLKDFRAPRQIQGFAQTRNRLVRKYPKGSYDAFPSARIVFERMEIIQAAATSALAGSGMIAESSLEDGQLTLQSACIPEPLMSYVQSSTEQMRELIEFLAIELAKIDEFGDNGIYDRSGLGEHSYDVV